MLLPLFPISCSLIIHSFYSLRFVSSIKQACSALQKSITTRNLHCYRRHVYDATRKKLVLISNNAIAHYDLAVSLMLSN